MKKAAFAVVLSLGLALPAAVASADQIAESWARDLDRSFPHSVVGVMADREASYKDFRFVDDSQVATSYVRDLDRSLATTRDLRAHQIEREISYIDFFYDSDPVKASYYRDVYRTISTGSSPVEANRVCSYLSWVDGQSHQAGC